jgi:hypothetical protein
MIVPVCPSDHPLTQELPSLDTRLNEVLIGLLYILWDKHRSANIRGGKTLQHLIKDAGRAIAQAVSRRLRAKVRSCWICGGQSGTEAGFSEYLGFPCQSSFHRLLHIHYHTPSGAGTIDQLVADVPSGLSLTPPQETEKQDTNPGCRSVQ